MAYPKESIKESSSLEDRLTRKFDDLQLARETRNHVAFDEISKSIEVLFKAVPKAHKDLMEEKKTLDEDLEEILGAIEEKAVNALDKITQQAIIENEGFSAQWEYRELYEEIIIELLQKYDLIPMKSPSYAEIESIPEEKEEKVVEIEPEPEPEKPRLSVKRNQRKENEDEFKV